MRTAAVPTLPGPAGEAVAVHRVPLAGDWSLWRLSAVRGTGMPVSWLDAFVPPDPDAASEEEARAVSAAAVRALAARPIFVEAVTWQNPAVVRNWLGRFAADPDGRLSRRDQREALVAFLAQRYCAKNETIGFFGPVAWARFVDERSGLTMTGSGGLRSRSVYRETWAVDAVARAFAADPRAAAHLIVRRNPVCDLTGGVLRRPRSRPEELTGAEAVVAAALTQPRRVGELVDTCAGAAAALDRLIARGVVLAGLPIPVQEHPERDLRRHVAGITDPDLRAELTGRLDELDRSVAAVAAAVGDPPALLDALDRLAETFGAITGQAGHRDKPGTPLGRAMVYEDCRRDLDVTIGADLLDDLRTPLALMLDTARWLLAEISVEVERDLTRRYRSLRDRAGGPVALCDLVLAAGDVLNGMPGTAADRVGDDFRERWRELLSTARGAPARMSSAVVAPLVRAVFPAGPVAWRAGRQHSPDLLLRADPAGGRPQWVLGELHLALNTMENRAFLTQADDRAELLDATAADFAGGRFVPVYPPDAPAVTSRTYPPPAMDLPSHYTYWSYTADEGHPEDVDPLPGAGLLVTEEDRRLVVRPAAGGRPARLLEVLGEFLTALVVNRFRVRDPDGHQPRLMLDEVVIARETWHVPLAGIPTPENADYRHRELRQWLIERGMPRFVFVKTADQPKPYLVDRDAPLSLRNLARGVRRSRAEHGDAAAATFTEMLPAPGELWLADADGQRYTSELRVVAYDEMQPNESLCLGDEETRT
ncbi:lantibiotic dehydratase [Micromonospora sp. NPDC126480]|uniref:lantibiotic dehydratase n=1 Tax=Micromonospora sp. NPDC126480 TaxID=3155312 RepID=UPI0033281444